MEGKQKHTAPTPERPERVKGEVITIEYIESRVGTLINDYMIRQDITNLKDISLNEWFGLCQYIQRHLFKDTDILRSKDMKLNGAMKSTCNKYNYSLISDILDLYIYLCNINNKIVNITGFSYFTGIDKEAIYSWNGSYKNNTSPEAFPIHKRIMAASEDTAAAAVVSGDGNKVGKIAYLNHYFGWNMPGVTHEVVTRPALSADQLPQLGPLDDSSDDKN